VWLAAILTQSLSGSTFGIPHPRIIRRPAAGEVDATTGPAKGSMREFASFFGK
jgi:hypothetical protein